MCDSQRVLGVHTVNRSAPSALRLIVRKITIADQPDGWNTEREGELFKLKFELLKLGYIPR